ncbi:Slp family lipoprotein, partial [Escherichia coli]
LKRSINQTHENTLITGQLVAGCKRFADPSLRHIYRSSHLPRRNGKTDTLLEIAVLPLDSYAKPDIEANYQGRLLARQSGFLDPVNYRNHFVTILGTIQGEQPGFINKVPYNFLEVNMQGIQVWHLREVVNTTYNLWDYGYGAFWPEPGWGAPYYTNAVSQVTPELVK